MAEINERPSPYELWRQANGNGDGYRRLLREHGHLIDRQPGDDGNLPCGWPGRRLLAEYTAHRVLAQHGPHERCAECEQILAEETTEENR